MVVWLGSAIGEGLRSDSTQAGGLVSSEATSDRLGGPEAGLDIVFKQEGIKQFLNNKLLLGGQLLDLMELPE